MNILNKTAIGDSANICQTALTGNTEKARLTPKPRACCHHNGIYSLHLFVYCGEKRSMETVVIPVTAGTVGTI